MVSERNFSISVSMFLIFIYFIPYTIKTMTTHVEGSENMNYFETISMKTARRYFPTPFLRTVNAFFM